MQRALAGIALLAVTLAACGGNGADPGGDDGSGAASDDDGGDISAGGDPTSVTVGWTTDITTLDFANGLTADEWAIQSNVFDHLVDRGLDGNPEPAVAEDWEYSDDGTQVTLTIRDDVLFHNGDPLTAEDVAASLQRLADPDFDAPASEHHSLVESVEAVGDYEVLVTFVSPQPLWVHNAPNRTPITPAGIEDVVGLDGSDATPENAVSTGPYRWVRWTRDDVIVLEAFEDHWRGAPAIDEVIIRPIPDASARMAALLSGDVDMINQVDIEQVSVVENAPGVVVRAERSLSRFFGTINAHERPGTPFEDRNVREALALALDLDLIVDNLLEGYGEVVALHTLPIEVAYNDELEPYPYDPDRARQLLEEAGHPDGIDGIEWVVRARGPKHTEIGTAIQAMWSEVGIQTNLTVLEDSDFSQRSFDNDLDLSLTVHQGAQTFHPNAGLRSIFGCEDGNANWSQMFCNREVHDILIDSGPAAEVTGDAEELWKEAQRLLWEDYATFAAIAFPWIYGVHEDLDWEPVPTGDMWMFRASWR